MGCGVWCGTIPKRTTSKESNDLSFLFKLLGANFCNTYVLCVCLHGLHALLHGTLEPDTYFTGVLGGQCCFISVLGQN